MTNIHRPELTGAFEEKNAYIPGFNPEKKAALENPGFISLVEQNSCRLSSSRFLTNCCRQGTALRWLSPAPGFSGVRSSIVSAVLVVIILLSGSVFANHPIQLYHEGVNSLRMRQLTPARERFETLIDKFPDHHYANEARFELARVLIDLREFEPAIELLNGLIDLPEAPFAPNQIRFDRDKARIKLLDTLYDLQRFRAGIDHLEKWWQEQPGDMTIGRQLSKFYLQAGRIDEARLVLEGLLERTASKDVFNDLLNLAMKTGEVEGLLNRIEQRRTRYRTADYLDFASDCYLAMNKEKEAVELLIDAVETNSDVNLLRKLARIAMKNDDHKSALETYRKMEKILPTDWEIIRGIGVCLYKLGQREEAAAKWRTIVDRNRSLESYQNLTEVLIAHKLFEDTLLAYDEARRTMGHPTYFSLERAGVLELLGRETEALEEYLSALSGPVYNANIFERLYEKQTPEFNLRQRIREKLEARPVPSLKQALLEVHMRDQDPESVDELISIDVPGGIFDDVIYERMKQEVFYRPSEFFHKLVMAMIKRNLASTLALNLSIMMLDFPGQSDEQAQRSVLRAMQVSQVEPPADLALQCRLLGRIGWFYLERLGNIDLAKEYLEAALDDRFKGVNRPAVFDSLLKLMRVQVFLEEFDEAEKTWQKAVLLNTTDGGLYDGSQWPGAELKPGDELEFLNSYSPFLVEKDAHARLIYEKAWLQSHRSKFQEALNELKKVTQSNPESVWMNDSLDWALFLTMASDAGLGVLDQYLKAERLFMAGDVSEAVEEMKKTAEVASGTNIGLDAAARAIFMSHRTRPVGELITAIDEFTEENPGHWLGADLLMLKLDLLEAKSAPKQEKLQLLQSFLDNFPSDLRSRHIRMLQVDLLGQKRGG
jgi:tetratricopeptide (TPR) repeat protein